MTRYRIRQGGVTIITGEDERAMWCYALEYRARGEVTIQHNAEGHWKRLALLAKWDALEAKP